ncbi:MAG: hypothetical protein ACXWLJ_06365, partial [Rhizomicrobium sp.]
EARRQTGSGTNLPQPARSAAVAHILQLDCDIVRIGEVKLRRAEWTGRAAPNLAAERRNLVGGKADEASASDRRSASAA